MKKSIVKKVVPSVVVLFLAFIFFYEPCIYGNDINEDDYYTAALKEYREGSYRQAAAKLESLLNILKEEKSELRAKVYLLLGACYEKLENKNKAGLYFLELRCLLDKKLIEQVPEIAGIDPESFPEYREVFSGGSFFTHKEPIPVSEMVKENVVHAPRKSVEEKEKEKKKKKFPWLIVLGSVVVVGITAVLLLTQKKEEKDEFIDIQWVRIPAGEFLMGDNFNEGQADELPVHKVYLSEYYISKYEITFEQFNHYCRDTGKNEKQLLTLRYREFPGGYPVRQVNYGEALAFCEWLSQKTGKNISLPTEAQWEKAARGNGQIRYPWGNDPPDCNHANYTDCADPDIAVFGLMPVTLHGSGKSPFGIYNMSGNVWEWCLDWYDASYYSNSPLNNPRGPAAGTHRVIRGGCYDDNPDEIRSANRHFSHPEIQRDNVGFRIVMEQDSATNP